MVRLMVGRDISQFYGRRPHGAGEPVLEADGLVTPANPAHRLSFHVRAGEIVGLAGLVGAGRTELLRVLFGVDPALAGELRVAGRPVKFHSPADAIRAGVALVPEDRKQEGLIVGMTVKQNLSLAGLSRHCRRMGVLSRRYEQEVTAEMIRRLNIKTPSASQVVHYLSGGNQQKVVLGKWMALEPRVLLLDEPTRGIDVGAKAEIHRFILELPRNKTSVILFSSELPELISLCDRVLVLRNNAIVGELQGDEINEEKIMSLAAGG
jgi:ribose transport system ATP-binding protein